jgi:D-alanyl-D-alanine carboxypeptidase/D-alanyl-D-alanine-endopeptidase (penicillin-binding protein 4)
MQATAPAVQFLAGAQGQETSAVAPRTPGTVPVIAASVVSHVLVLRSEPLLPLLKSLDDYSNNIVAPLAQAAGGAAAVEQLARASVPTGMRSEITLGDGAGTDPRNRLSPRAAVKLLQALEQQLATTGHALPDVLPVSGVDAGTLHDRLNGPGAVGRIVGKTGTYGDYGASALIGAIRTRDRGEVYFAILNHGVPVPVARHRQDDFVRALLAQLQPLAWEHKADPLPAIARAQLTVDP